MIAELTAWVQDVMDLWPLWAAIGSTLAALIVWAAKAWLKANVADPITAMSGEVTETKKLVKYHLGPNGTARPVHERIRLLERAHDIEEGP